MQSIKATDASTVAELGLARPNDGPNHAAASFVLLACRASAGDTYMIYDTIEEFNADSKTACDQLNLAHVARWPETKKHKKKLKQTNAGAHTPVNCASTLPMGTVE